MLPPPGDVPVKGFKCAQLTTFAGIIVGYSCYYITRNSLIFTAPAMVDSDMLPDIDKNSIGVITSIFPLCYGCSKFISGVLSDKFSPHIMLGGALAATSLCNIAFGYSSSLTWFCIFAGLNGVLQGCGAPSCAKFLTAWFPTKERGTYWGLWNISHNLGGFLAPIIAGTAARAYGWSYGVWVPGCIGLVVSVGIVTLMKDTPVDAGYPAVEDPSMGKKDMDDPQKKKLSLWQNLKTNVLSNPGVWCLAICYFFVYAVRQGVTSWAIFYMIEVKGAKDAGEAAMRVSGLELGGLCGSLLAGKFSDARVNAAGEGYGKVGLRIQIVIAYLVGVAASLAMFWVVPDTWWMQWCVIFCIGFFLYGPQMLIGLCGAELVGPDAVGASQGFLGWIAYAGAVLILCSYCAHTVRILCSCCAHTVRILCSYCAHTVLILLLPWVYRVCRCRLRRSSSLNCGQALWMGHFLRRSHHGVWHRLRAAAASRQCLFLHTGALLILCSYCAHAVLMLYLYCTHTVNASSYIQRQEGAGSGMEFTIFKHCNRQAQVSRLHSQSSLCTLSTHSLIRACHFLLHLGPAHQMGTVALIFLFVIYHSYAEQSELVEASA
jgi:sugar phosphate permease